VTRRGGLPPNPRRTPASDRLTGALLDLAARGQRPPCGEFGAAELWTSDDYRERRLAVAWCEPCPIKAECHAAAEANGEKWGVWAGIDRTAHTGRPTQKAAGLDE